MKITDIAVTLIDHMGSELSVCNAARVSFDKTSEWDEEWRFDDIGPYLENVLSDKDAKLIGYLARHKHTSPFNHCFATFRVKAPIFVARQLVKHKFMPWNEVSRRYVDNEPEFYFPEYWRKKAENVKQGSLDEPVVSDPYYRMNQAYDSVEASLDAYRMLLDQGVCPEQARMVLPQNTMTEWIWSGSLGAIADMCRLRLDSHSQYETRKVAEKIAAEMEKLYPVSWKALMGVR